MKSSCSWLVFIFSLILGSNAFAWSHKIQGSGEIREVLFSGPDGELTLTVSLYQEGLVDIAVNTERGETVYFHSERTSYSCSISSEQFVIGDTMGTMVLVTLGGRESYVFFIKHSDLCVYQSFTPTEAHNCGGPGRYFESLLDVDGDGNYDHLAYPEYLFYLPGCQAHEWQIWLEFCQLPSLDANGKINLEDNTLSILVRPESQTFRDTWIESMSSWLEESAGLSQTYPSIQEARGKVWAFKEALSSNNYELVSELYPEL